MNKKCLAIIYTALVVVQIMRKTKQELNEFNNQRPSDVY
jgi:hypothetical protein